MQIVIAALLAAFSAPLVKKVLIALGFGMVSYVGFSTIKGALSTAITTYFGNLGASLYGVLGLIGFIDAAGIWLGAFTAVVAVLTAKRLSLI